MCRHWLLSRDVCLAIDIPPRKGGVNVFLFETSRKIKGFNRFKQVKIGSFHYQLYIGENDVENIAIKR